MEIKTWTFQQAELESTINIGKAFFISKMVDEGVITGEQGKEMLGYALALTTKKENRFGDWLTKLIFRKVKDAEDEGRASFVVIKLIVSQEDDKIETVEPEEVIDAGKAN